MSSRGCRTRITHRSSCQMLHVDGPVLPVNQRSEQRLLLVFNLFTQALHRRPQSFHRPTQRWCIRLQWHPLLQQRQWVSMFHAFSMAIRETDWSQCSGDGSVAQRCRSRILMYVVALLDIGIHRGRVCGRNSVNRVFPHSNIKAMPA